MKAMLEIVKIDHEDIVTVSGPLACPTDKCPTDLSAGCGEFCEMD